MYKYLLLNDNNPRFPVYVTPPNKIIVPSVLYFDKERAKEIFRPRSKKREKRRKEREKRKIKREKRLKKQSHNVVNPEDEYLDSMMLLEMQMFQMDDDDKKIIKEEGESDQPRGEEEIIIDEILAMPIDSFMSEPAVPDRLLTPRGPRYKPASAASRAVSGLAGRRLSIVSEEGGPGPGPGGSDSSIPLPLPLPLSPPYLPGRPVLGIWAANHNTDRLYRYTHIERIVYPHERVIFPPGFRQ